MEAVIFCFIKFSDVIAKNEFYEVSEEILDQLNLKISI